MTIYLLLHLLCPSAEAQDTEEPPVATVAPVAQEVQLEEALSGRPEGFGAGIQLGSLSGPSLVHRTAEGTIQGAVGWGFASLGYQGSIIQLCGDYTRNLRVISSEDSPEISFAIYSGTGARLTMYNFASVGWSSLGLRVPVGVAVLPKHLRIDGYFQLAPTLQIYPSSALVIEVNMGGRYYF
jgi:hypothetical protein